MANAIRPSATGQVLRLPESGGACRTRGAASDPARVLTETVTAVGPGPPGLKGLGETVHWEKGGAPTHPNAIGWLNPLTVVTLSA